MKKDLKMLAVFIALLLSAVICGIFAGNYVAGANVDIMLSPPMYMQKVVYASPWLMAVAVMAVVFYATKSKNGKEIEKTAEVISIYTFTVMGIIVSGFCGMYTMADFIKVAIGMVAGVLVTVALAIIRLYCSEDTHRIHNGSADKNIAKAVLFVVYSIMVVLSAFVPFGPLPILVIGLVWGAFALKKNK